MTEYFEEFVSINGIQEYFLHYPGNTDTVILFLHGGPGQTEAFFGYLTIPTKPYCTFVFYDQRGCGKTQAKNNSSPKDISLPVLLEDLHQSIQYVRRKYKPHRLILLGHSWGSVLATEYIKSDCSNVDAYIGMGQAVNMREGSRICYDKLHETIQQSGNMRDLKQLHKLGDYPNNLTPDNFSELTRDFRRLQFKYKLAVNYATIIKDALRSPVLSPRDIAPFFTGGKVNRMLNQVIPDYRTDDFTDYKIPIFYICGPNDWIVPSSLTEKYYRSISAPKKDLFWIRGAGHMPNVDNPEVFNNVIKFITSN